MPEDEDAFADVIKFVVVDCHTSIDFWYDISQRDKLYKKGKILRKW